MNTGIQRIEAFEIYNEPYRSYALIDVRSPKEFSQGHIPRALNIALFTDDERATIGMIYRNNGKIAAIEKGLEIIGPKMNSLTKQLRDLVKYSDSIIVYCWRGGMRSASIAWLFELIDKKVFVIQGGYKAYRQFIQDSFNRINLNLRVLGGRTGSAKTQILRNMKAKGIQVLDFEELAKHMGSAFGWILSERIVGTEEFENQIYECLHTMNLDEVIWVENESRGVGIAQIPEGIWKQMRAAPLVHLDVNLEIRLDHLVSIYFNDNTDKLSSSFEKIRKRLGHLKTNQAIQFLNAQNLREAARIALTYYDKTYDFGLKSREPKNVYVLSINNFELDKVVKEILSIPINLKNE